MPEKGSDGGRGWWRAAGLMLLTGMLSVVNPGILVAVPLALLNLFRRPFKGMALLVALVVMFTVLGGAATSGLWYAERGWAFLLGGWFLALTLRWPRESFLTRGLGAVAGTFAATGLLFWVRPGQWAILDWAITSRMKEGMALAIQALRGTMGPEAVSVGFESRALEAMAFQGVVFPALLGLASLTGLATAWWLHLRLIKSREVGIEPVKEFRFNDQLVWVLILGFLLLLGSSGLLTRLGTNTVVFMGALYALRGVGVLLFLTGGPSLFGGALLLLGFVFVAPLLIVGAFVIGLGDTWLNLRARRGATPSS